MEKWSEFLGKKKLWLGKVTSVLCGKPENNPFGQCVVVYGKQVAALGKKAALKLILTWPGPRQSVEMIGTPMTRDWVFQICKEKGTITLKMMSNRLGL